MKGESCISGTTERVLERIVEHAPIAACVIDTENFHVLYRNTRYNHIINNYDANEKRCYTLLYGHDEPCEACPALRYRVEGGEMWDVVENFNNNSGSWLTTHFIMIDVPHKQPLCLAFFEEYSHPISYSREKTPSHFDTLTGLVNHRGYEHEGAAMYARAQEQGHRVAVMALKIDGLSQVNSLYGYKAGDGILKRLSHAMLGLLPRQALFARLRRNEFCALLPLEPPLTNLMVHDLARRMCSLPSTLVSANKQVSLCQIFAGASIQDQAESFADLNLLAGEACARAVTSEEQPYEVVERPHIHQRIVMKQLKNELPDALLSNELELFFQPKYDARDARLVGAEALLRWNHVTHGQIAPGLFIPMAESSGHIGAVDTWVIKESCRLLRMLRQQGYDPVSISINVSPRTFFDINLEEVLSTTCAEYDIAPEWLEIELTESTALHNLTLTQGIMARLRAKGFRILMDDFGTGHSSLSNLNLLPFDTIKIDRGFIANICSKTRRVFPSIVSLVRNHEMNIVVEGVETQEQLDIVQEAGCHIVQGYYFSKPVSIDRFKQMLKAS